MNESLRSSVKSLPPLPESVTQIQRICAMPDASLADLAIVAEKDPMITANLLKAANSPFYGFSREIKSVQQAVSLFGMATVKGLALSGAIKQVMTIDMAPYKLTPNDLANISQVQNIFVNNWFKNVNKSLLDILSPASFLQLTGAIVIAQEIIKLNKIADFQKIIEETGDISLAEKEIAGATTPRVTAEIFEHWRFDAALTEAILASENPQEANADSKQLSSVLYVARQFVPLYGDFNEDTLNKAIECASSFELETVHLQDSAKAILKSKY